MRYGSEDGQARLDASEAGDYEQLPYPSMPFPYTQPAHLAALATLYGLEPPAADSARVLELGCAAGGNIIPLAARHPGAQFLGIDLSQRHIREGQQRIAALGLSNIELRQTDVTEAKYAAGRFDYIICHGVFSWVPRAAQDAIFRICREALAANGLATISYNVLPGWHFRSVVRDICLHRVRDIESPSERVAAARQALAEIALSASETEPYGMFLRSEASKFASMPSAYINGEFLVPDNAPCHFHEFVGRAREHELSFLCEGDLGSSTAELLYPAVAKRIKALAGWSRLSEEQYKDFITGRPFRRSILIRADQEAKAAFPPTPDRLRTLHFASRLTFEAAQPDGSRFTYKDPRGRTVATKSVAVNFALSRLAEAYPSTLSLKELVAQGDSDGGLAEAADEAQVCSALFALTVAGQASISALPVKIGRADCGRPKLWALTQLEAAAKQPWLTSLTHAVIPIQTMPIEIFGYLHGGDDRAAVIAQIAKCLRDRTIEIPELPLNQVSHPAQIEAAARQYLDRALRLLAEHALLMPDEE